MRENLAKGMADVFTGILVKECNVFSDCGVWQKRLTETTEKYAPFSAPEASINCAFSGVELTKPTA